MAEMIGVKQTFCQEGDVYWWGLIGY